MLAVVLVVAVLGIGFGVSFVREGSLVVPSLDIGLEVAVEDVIGFGVSPIVGLALITWVVIKWVVSGPSVVTLDVPTLSIGFGVSSMRVGPAVDP